MYFFFFKQKTAYEMRISDWSSDVCSSDLDQAARHRRLPHPRFAHDEPLAQCSRDADPQFEHRHRADRRPAWPREDGGAFPRSRVRWPPAYRTQGARLPAVAEELGPGDDDDRQLWPWHRGDAAAPRERLCRPRQRDRKSAVRGKRVAERVEP